MGTLVVSPPETELRQPANQLAATTVSLREYWIVAIWFGMVAGLLDGAELLLFQRINWEQWGSILHVSKQILWIDPALNVAVFVTLSLIFAMTAQVIRVNLLPLVTWTLTFVTIFDWLSAAGRLSSPARLLMALGLAAVFDRLLRVHRAKALRFWSKTSRWLLALWVLVFVVVRGGAWAYEHHVTASLPEASPGTPNVLIIVIDTLRADHLSSYGYGRTTTPNLDRIAQQGVLFENAMSTSSWTLPSHASILTGRYPSEHRMQDHSAMRLGSPGLREFRTLGEGLQASGYRTGAFSSNYYFFTSTVGLAKGFIRFEDYFYSPEDAFVRTFGCFGEMHVSDCGYSFKRAPEVNSEALNWIGNGEHEHPFFAFLNYFGVHEADTRLWQHNRPVWGTGNEVDRYDSALAYTDAEIGKLFHELQKRGLTNNTVFLITSDHGQSLGQHHLFHHGSSLYLEQIHVPLIIWYPGHVPAGVRVAAPISNAAIAATVMNLTGKSNPFRGSGLSPFWSGNSLTFDYPNAISELSKKAILDDCDMPARTLVPTSVDGDMSSIVTPEWHLIEHQTLGKQLYNWKTDPGESRNLINTPEGSAVAGSLELEMQGHK